MNPLFAPPSNIQPAVGLSCTIRHWNDRTHATIFRVFQSGKTTFVELRHDKASKVSGSARDGSAEYTFAPDAEGGVSHFYQTKYGTWLSAYKAYKTGRWVKASKGPSLQLGRHEQQADA